eukprot:6194244-Pleurochrysis_carterae.AAC.2
MFCFDSSRISSTRTRFRATPSLPYLREGGTRISDCCDSFSDELDKRHTFPFFSHMAEFDVEKMVQLRCQAHRGN